MKRIALFLLALLMGALTAFSQENSASFSALKGQKRVAFNIDYSQADIMGMSEDQFRFYESDWDKDKHEVMENVLEKTNGELWKEGVAIGLFKDTQYILEYRVREINRNGNFFGTLALVKVSEDGSQELITEKELNPQRAYWDGTKLRKIKKGAKRLGRTIGLFLSKEMK